MTKTALLLIIGFPPADFASSGCNIYCVKVMLLFSQLSTNVQHFCWGNQAYLRLVTMARTKLSVQRMAGIKRVISETLLGEFIEYTIKNHKVIQKNGLSNSHAISNCRNSWHQWQLAQWSFPRAMSKRTSIQRMNFPFVIWLWGDMIWHEMWNVLFV